MTVRTHTGGRTVSVSVTRPNDTTAYGAGDVIGSATGSSAALEFQNIAPSAGSVLITSAALTINAAAVISGETSYALAIYSATPPSASGDNAAWDVPAGDRAYFLGKIDLGTPVDLGSTLYVRSDIINMHVDVESSSLFAYLITNGAHTPTASRVYKIDLSVLPL